MIRRPPRSTLFPYTRSSDLTDRNEPACGSVRPRSSRINEARAGRPRGPTLATVCAARISARIRKDLGLTRSEEHTSELQSLAYLVCRLLLEKKKLVYKSLLY